MAWTQLILTFRDRDWLAPVSDFFAGLGATASEIDGRRPRVITLFPQDTDLEPILARFSIFREALDIPEPQVEQTTLPDTDWVAAFREHFRPFRMNRYVQIVPEWEADGVPEDPGILVVDPGQAFGTGLHATTALAGELVWETVQSCPTRRVLDVGCGTGILSITALHAGARQVTALDIDPLCSHAIRRHMALNGIPKQAILPFIGTVQALRPIRYDLVIINIIETVIRSILPSILPLIAHHIVFSGVLADATDSFRSYLESAGLQLEDTRTREEWAAFRCRRASCT